MEFAIDLDDGLDGGASWDIAATDDFCGDSLVGFVGFAADEVEGFAFEKREEHGFGDGIVAVGLLEDLESGLAGGVAEDHGIGFEFGGGAGEGDLVGTGFEVDGQGIANDGEALVIDGDGGLGGEGRGREEEEESEIFHRVKR